MDAYINANVKNSWNPILNDVVKKYNGLVELRKFIDSEYANYYLNTFPRQADIFRAFDLTLDKINVVIIGQDPYPNPLPNGRAFDCEYMGKCEASLRNINKEISDTYGKTRDSCNLSAWAQQGVFLINTVLTIRKGHSHMGHGWEEFTGEVLRIIAQNRPEIPWLILGQKALGVARNVGVKKYIYAAHPSPLSAKNGFFGSRCFAKIDEISPKKINWLL